MADNKKYYYLKLKDNFFDTDAMIVLESMPDGYLYSNILLKLYLRSLRNEGKLMFNDRIPYNSTILAQVTRQSVGVVEKALQIFQQLDLIEILDNGAIYMLDIQEFIGQSSTEADRIRKYRNQIIKEKTNGVQMLQQVNDKSTPEIEIEKEIKIEKELEQEKEANSSDNIFSYFQQRGFISISPMMVEDINTLVEMYSLEEVKQAVDIADRNGKHSLSYVKGIIERRRADGGDRNANDRKHNKPEYVEGIGFEIG
ncbi:phage replisome organizer N-terminal domain-containing protein [Clostridium cadaveris]|uniref:phage replisome organizer N-terminal domain-containing protein n=1 Tax=Clostridium cadaveris TaxID=1529 RepID=UPI0015B6FDE8|nr:phage replisome organizer N-terminal domain-containing protein [Clostridium cadaveris]NWK13004.1 phage replisome organizer N-terminal domain-containing protein [Clostridium cadaveris]